MLYTASGESTDRVMPNAVSANFVGSRDNETKRKRRFRIVRTLQPFLTCSATVCGPEKQKSVSSVLLYLREYNIFS